MTNPAKRLSPLGEAALAWWDEGKSIIPLKPGDKVPLGEALPLNADGSRSWKQYQTTRATREQVEKWWTAHPDANIGLLTGPINGLAVIDFDGPEAVKAVQEAGIEIPRTRVHKTPRGFHYLYAWTEGFPQTTNALAHVDTRGEGGYIVAPPSVRPEGAYKVVYDGELKECPPQLIAKLAARQPVRVTVEGEHAPWVRELLAGVGEGQRNQAAIRLAGYFHHRGVAADILLEVMRQFGSRCQPAMSEREIQGVVHSVQRYQTMAASIGVIDPPLFQALGDGFRYEWPDRNVTVDLRRLKWGSREIECILEVTARLNGYPRPLVLIRRTDLLATTVLPSIAKQLSQSTSEHDVPWGAMLNDVAILTYKQLLEGEPVTAIADGMNVPDDDLYLLEPLILQNGPTMWFGPGGSGKTLFAMLACMDIHDGEHWLGCKRHALRRVLYVDFEQMKRDHHRRLRALLPHSERKTTTVLYQNYRGASLGDRLEHLQRSIVEEGITFVVIDSVLPACNDDPLKPGVATTFMNQVASLGVGALLLSHVTKLGEDKFPFGSVMWGNLCRSTWYVTKYQEEGDTVMYSAFYNRKSNWDTQHKPIGYEVDWTHGIEVKRKDVADTPELADKMSEPARVTLALKRHALTIDEIAASSGIDKQHLYVVLPRMERAGKVLLSADKKWGLLV